MTATERLARNLGVDISADASTWLPLPAQTDVNSSASPDKQDSTNYDGSGYKRNVTTLNALQVVSSYISLIDSGTVDPAHAMVEACEAKFAPENQLYIRVYDLDGGDYGRQFLADVTIARSATGVGDLKKITATFDSNDDAPVFMDSSAIADLVAARNTGQKPVVLSASPSGVAAGGAVIIKGKYLSAPVATTGVKFGATNATSWAIISDFAIAAIMPAGSAGAGNITVTNAAGASNVLPYTRGA